MHTFIAHLKVAPGREAELQALLADVRDKTLGNEPGVAYYEFAISADDPGRYMVVEVYRDAAAQASHMATEWVQASIPKTMALIEDIEIRQYVSPGTRPVGMSLPAGIE